MPNHDQALTITEPRNARKARVISSGVFGPGTRRDDEDRVADRSSGRLGLVVARSGSGARIPTIACWRSNLQAALAYGADEFGDEAPKLRAIKNADADRIAYLTSAQEAGLLAAYSAWAQPVMIILCETGMRTQKALRLDWRSVLRDRDAILVEHTAGQTGRGRRRSAHAESACARSSGPLSWRYGRVEDGRRVGRDHRLPHPRLAAPLRGLVPEARR